MKLIEVWSVLTMLQDASMCIDLTQKTSETERIGNFLMERLPITKGCADKSAERAFDSMAAVFLCNKNKEASV